MYWHRYSILYIVYWHCHLQSSRNLPCSHESWWDMEMPRTSKNHRKTLNNWKTHPRLNNTKIRLSNNAIMHARHCNASSQSRLEVATGLSPGKAWKCGLFHANGWLRCLARNALEKASLALSLSPPSLFEQHQWRLDFSQSMQNCENAKNSSESNITIAKDEPTIQYDSKHECNISWLFPVEIWNVQIT